MRLAAVALGIMALLTPLQAAAAKTTLTPQDVLGNFANVDATTTYLPGSNGAVAQNVSDKMFNALAKVLGGQAPSLNFVQSIGSGGADASATIGANRVNVDPLIMQALVNPRDQYHGKAVNTLPHEFMHLRQTSDVLGNTEQREGGAQAFADVVTADAAKQAAIPYDGGGTSYDGNYAPLVQAVTQKYGRDWILGGQMGKPPVTWP